MGLSLNELGETESRQLHGKSHGAHGVQQHGHRLDGILLPKHDKEKVWQCFQRMEAAEEDVDVEFYSDHLTNEQIEQFWTAGEAQQKRQFG